MYATVKNLISTRGVDGKHVTLKSAILNSQPEDKGLFTFEEFPEVSLSELKTLVDLAYQYLAKTLLGKFDFEISTEVLNKIIDGAYGSQWDTNEIVPVIQLEGNSYLLELFHGPTQSFKDIALQFLPRVLSAYRQKGEIIRALGASSGDTISAAHFGVGDVKGLQSCFLLPKDGPSEIQRLQATAHGFKNAITILINGSFDDGQRAIKEILTNPKYSELKSKHNFTSFNSINIARILAQIVYYFWGYLSLVRKGVLEVGDRVNFSTPSGNFGNALAGVYAAKMGLPIGKINVATNSNDVLDRFIKTGRYSPGNQLVKTLAPSQDITVASNFERMIFEVLTDAQRVTLLMNELATKGFFEVTTNELEKFRTILSSSKASDSDINKTIINTYERTGIVIDPHTATGVYGGQKVFGREVNVPTVFIATADHIKFEQPDNIPIDQERYNRVLERLRKNEEDYLVCDADEESIVNKVEESIKIINSRI